MGIEKVLKKSKSLGRRFLTGIALTGALSFAGCQQKVDITTPDDITIDPKHVGMIEGRTVYAKIATNNEIVFSGYQGASISLLKPDFSNTNFKTTSVSGGVYAVDNIPTGSYIVAGNGPRTGYAGEPPADYEPAIVSSQQSYKVSDLIVDIDRQDRMGIMHGKVKKVDGTPYANKTVELWDADRTSSGTFPARKEASTVTLSDGSYAFYFRQDEYYLKSPEGTLQVGDWTPVGYYEPSRVLFREEDNVNGPVINQDITFISN